MKIYKETLNYGEIGKNFIEVHHIKTLSEINEEYRVNPFDDLRSVCPNCHAILHKANVSIEELRRIIQNNHQQR
jgi:5-methylcytosine-specific restriction enzyme A